MLTFQKSIVATTLFFIEEEYYIIPIYEAHGIIEYTIYYYLLFNNYFNFNFYIKIIIETIKLILYAQIRINLQQIECSNYTETLGYLSSQSS